MESAQALGFSELKHTSLQGKHAFHPNLLTYSATHGICPLALSTVTMCETTVEIRKAADELFRLSEMDVKACTKQRKRRTKEKQKEHTFPTIFIDTL
ncbi:hypothetical protein EVAR_88295_1 [Eumeta japonica]|uniref:Uncharacterized protein n=1 Tax=Eumeta variegata TaxID=151549 RepID=A0A4C1VPV6_EUMVA|nr:hypothetical protein EVAR_88295_1 [Eumeta japonica]